jgi:integrase
MRGHITKRGKGSYTIVIDLGRDPKTGKRQQHWESIKGNKKDAEKRLSELLSQIDNGIFIQPKKTTIEDYLKIWLNDYVKSNLSPKGYERYESIVRVHITPNLGKILLTELKPEHVQKYYTDKLNSGLSPRTVRYHHVVLHKALKTAVKWELIIRNVIDAVDPPRPRKTEMTTWDEIEVSKFLEAAKKTEYYPLFHTAIFTGMRRSELLALRWRDVDLTNSQISISRSLHQLKDGTFIFTQPKTVRSQRTIAISPSSISVLKELHEKQKLERLLQEIPLNDDDLVFSHFDGKPLRPNTVSRAWTIIASRAELKVIRFHDARHTHASLMLKQGVHPKIVQERLGHSSIAVTLDTYSHVAPGLQKKAANLFDEVISTQYNNPDD